ncbi:hypothetical protein FPRO03_11428 [Fusarium proliferatum]|nr:hypothetical protein FPRO03_11428 [Fusarium proliferatum]
MLCRSVCPDDSGGYEFVVIGLWKYESLLRDHVAVGIPRSGGPSHDKCALQAFSELQLAGYEVLAWRPYCKEAMPYMDRDGNTLTIEERPPLKGLDELEDTGEDNTKEKPTTTLSRDGPGKRAVMLQKELDKTDGFTHFEMVFDRHKDEKDRNGQSCRLVEIGSGLHDAWDRVWQIWR